MSPRGPPVCMRRPSSQEKSHPEKGAWRASLIKRSNSSSVSIWRALACLITRTGTPSRRGYESGQFWQSSRSLPSGPGCNVPEHWGQMSRSLWIGSIEVSSPCLNSTASVSARAQRQQLRGIHTFQREQPTITSANQYPTHRTNRQAKKEREEESISEDPEYGQMWRGLCFSDQFS